MTAPCQDIGDGIPGLGVTRLPVKQVGMALPYLTLMAAENCKKSCVITGNIVAALRGQEKIRTTNHTSFLREGREEVRKRNARRSEGALVDNLSGAHVQVTFRLQQVTKRGAWRMVQPGQRP